jgi:hypothetical protein
MSDKLELVHSALIIAKEAMQYVVEQKRSRAEFALFAEDGSYAEALMKLPELRPALMQLRDQILGIKRVPDFITDPHEVLSYALLGNFETEILDSYIKFTDPVSKTEYKFTKNLIFSYTNGQTSGSLKMANPCLDVVDGTRFSYGVSDPISVFTWFKTTERYPGFSDEELMELAKCWVKGEVEGVFATFRTTALKAQAAYEVKFGFKKNPDYLRGMNEWDLHGERIYIGRQYDSGPRSEASLTEGLVGHRIDADGEVTRIEYEY